MSNFTTISGFLLAKTVAVCSAVPIVTITGCLTRRDFPIETLINIICEAIIHDQCQCNINSTKNKPSSNCCHRFLINSFSRDERVIVNLVDILCSMSSLRIFPPDPLNNPSINLSNFRSFSCVISAHLFSSTSWKRSIKSWSSSRWICSASPSSYLMRCKVDRYNHHLHQLPPQNPCKGCSHPSLHYKIIWPHVCQCSRYFPPHPPWE